MRIKTLLTLLLINISAAVFADGANRLIVLADMGNEPDEQQQIVHLMLYTDKFEVEGLIAVTGKYLNPASSIPSKQRLYPELFEQIIDGYAKVYDNLKLHSPNFAKPEALRAVVKCGQRGYGSGDVGEGKESEGSQLIYAALERQDERPIYVIVNAGSNTLAQALFDYQRDHSKKEMQRAIAKLRVFENGAQDDCGAMITHSFPDIYWVRSNYQAYCYAGPANDGSANNKGNEKQLGPHTWQPYAYTSIGQHQWAVEHIISGNGALGHYWVLRSMPNGRLPFMEGGGTVPFLSLIDGGLSNIDHFEWGGWSGRYSRVKGENYWSKHDSVNKDEVQFTPFMMYIEEGDEWIDPETGDRYEGIFTPVWRWRRAFMNDFKFRMDWCRSPFERCNHNPTAVVNGDESDAAIIVEIKAGESVTFDGSKSYDIDGECDIQFNWFNYHEAGTYPTEIQIKESDRDSITFTAPKDSRNCQIHIILEIRDNADYQEAMYDYKRIVINVK